MSKLSTVALVIALFLCALGCGADVNMPAEAGTDLSQLAVQGFPLSAPCDVHDQCASNLCMVDNLESTPDAMRCFGRAGDSCDLAGRDFCMTGHHCELVDYLLLTLDGVAKPMTESLCVVDECSRQSDCPAGVDGQARVCHSGACVDSQTHNASEPCDFDWQCPGAGARCDMGHDGQRRCFGAAGAACEQPHGSDKDYCVHFTTCLADSDGAAAVCTAMECTPKTGCPDVDGMPQSCVDHTCVYPLDCTTNADCGSGGHGEAQQCVNGQCASIGWLEAGVECDGNSQCATGDCVFNAFSELFECTIAAGGSCDQAADDQMDLCGPGAYCGQDAVCEYAECTLNADCAAGASCLNGSCVVFKGC